MKPEKLKPMVLAVLASYPQSRDSDQWLTIKLWQVFFPELLISITDREGKVVPAVTLRNIMSLPREDNVKRIRAIIQNEEHKFLPTTWEVARKRQINEGVWLEYVRNN